MITVQQQNALVMTSRRIQATQTLEDAINMLHNVGKSHVEPAAQDGPPSPDIATLWKGLFGSMLLSLHWVSNSASARRPTSSFSSYTDSTCQLRQQKTESGARVFRVWCVHLAARLWPIYIQTYIIRFLAPPSG